MNWNPLVPELMVENYERAKTFYTRIFGFTLVFERDEDRFGYFDMNGAQVMLLERRHNTVLGSISPQWNGHALHFQIEVNNVDEIVQRLLNADIDLLKAPYTVWYRHDQIEYEQREFFVHDSDGFVFRFFEAVSERLVPAMPAQSPSC